MTTAQELLAWLSQLRTGRKISFEYPINASVCATFTNGVPPEYNIPHAVRLVTIDQTRLCKNGNWIVVGKDETVRGAYRSFNVDLIRNLRILPS